MSVKSFGAGAHQNIHQIVAAFDFNQLDPWFGRFGFCNLLRNRGYVRIGCQRGFGFNRGRPCIILRCWGDADQIGNCGEQDKDSSGDNDMRFSEFLNLQDCNPLVRIKRRRNQELRPTDIRQKMRHAPITCQPAKKPVE